VGLNVGISYLLLVGKFNKRDSPDGFGIRKIASTTDTILLELVDMSVI
jgi:hypothetical protein